MKNILRIILVFFLDDQNNLSSKRLAFLLSVPFGIAGTLAICCILLKNGHLDHLLRLWDSFLIFVAVLGGYVSAEIFKKNK